ncbi:MAG: hypothetical protein GWN66_04945 [Pseudomonas stutzeri]|nr:hypothetical protein [Stutzerimonas stutzeri]
MHTDNCGKGKFRSLLRGLVRLNSGSAGLVNGNASNPIWTFSMGSKGMSFA